MRPMQIRVRIDCRGCEGEGYTLGGHVCKKCAGEGWIERWLGADSFFIRVSDADDSYEYELQSKEETA